MTAASYAFRAVRPNGSIETGLVEASSREAAIALVAERGAFVVTMTSRHPGISGPGGPTASDLAVGLRSLATLLASGVPLSRALAILGDLAPPSWTAALPELQRRVERGELLGAALAASSLSLPPHIVGIIQAGEAAGGLGGATLSAAALLEGRAATRAAIRTALAYPAMLAIAGSASAALLVGVVLPRFAALIADANQRLPPTTWLVLQLGTVARVTAIPILFMAAVAATWWQRRLAQPDRRRRWHRWLQGLPGVGPVRRAAASANACATLAALLEAGVPVSVALHHTAPAAGDSATAAALLEVRHRIAKGESISAAMTAESALTPSAIRLIRVGEETGRLSAMLAHAGRIEADQAALRLQGLIRVIEPALILLFGGLVAVVAAALLQAMYSLRPAI